ncbi:MAG: cytochrome c-type biogenesis protein CcmH [Alphaproteobacteria bacterium]|nr:cytochrome c-type biogenesis protein CcmH [Alphaproteobacteria bacterium]
MIDDSEFFEFSETLRAREHKISQKLRCPICQGQSIAESDALIAKRLRLMVLEELQKGKNEQEIIVEIKKRYGDYVSFKPPFNSGTLMLWLGPFLILGLILYLARHKFSWEQSE